MINQITKMRLPDGTEVAFVDWSDQPLWSRAFLLEGFTDDEVPFFTYAPGDAVSTTSNVVTGRQSTEADTNVTLAGAFADTEEMLVYAIKPELSVYTTANASIASLTLTTLQPMPTAAQLKILSDALLLRLWISQKVMLEGPLGYFNTGFGPHGVVSFVDAAAAASTSGANQGLPSQEAVRSLAMPVYIGGTEKYRVTLTNPGGTAVSFGGANDVLMARIILDGLYKRPVS